MKYLFRGFHECNGTKTIKVNEAQYKGEWIEGDLITQQYPIYKNLTPPLITDKNGVWEVIPETVGQWTRLNIYSNSGIPLDKIFESDILKHIYTGELFVVYLEKGCFKGFKNNKDFLIRPVESFLMHSEVIGNIWENPELVEVK